MPVQLRGEETRITSVGQTFADMITEPGLCGGMRHVLDVWERDADQWLPEIVEAVDQLFATLDPTLRKLELPDRGEIVLADTVGFVRDLPHELIAAFKSTLEETRDARLLLHVTDCSDPAHLERIAQVDEVLKTVGADGLPVIHVYNKADILGVPPRIDRAETGMPMRVWLSAVTGEGVDLLLTAIAEYLFQDRVCGTLRLDVSQARLRSLIYSVGQVLEEELLEEGGWDLKVDMDRRDFEKLQSREGLEFFASSVESSAIAAGGETG